MFYISKQLKWWSSEYDLFCISRNCWVQMVSGAIFVPPMLMYAELLNYIRKACKNTLEQSMMLISCKIAKQIMSFLELLDGKISNGRLSMNVLSIIQATSMMHWISDLKNLKAHCQVWDNFCNWKPFKSDEKCFLFHLKSSLRSQDIQVFVLKSWSYSKTAW